MRDPVSPGVKLAVTVKQLHHPGKQYGFRVVSSTINRFVPEVCDTIIRAHQDQVMWCPTLPEDRLQVESVFRRMGSIPLALGALDRKQMQSDIHKGETTSTTTTRAFTL